MTDQMWRLSLVVSFHPKAGFVIPVGVRNELVNFLGIAALRAHIGTATVDLAICGAILKERV